MAAPSRTLYVLLPIFNEAAGLALLLDKIAAASASIGMPYRVLALDDGSTDGSGAILEHSAATQPIEVLRHAINRGLGETVRDLFERAAALAEDDDVIVRLDADDTHDPELIAAMIRRIDEGHDVVIASRFQPGGGQRGVNAYRTVLTRGANGLMRLVFPIPGVREYTCGFRAYRGRIIREAIDTFGNNFVQLKGLGFTSTLEKLVKLHMLGASVSEVPFTLRYDQKQSDSKMLGSVTTFGYLTLAVLYYWPWRGWRSTYNRALLRQPPDARAG